ncbi:hypothetical protein A2U01_0076629, partial [Trifolium medium]|nr:hypothetical protein [Trifolium medium]
AFPVKKIEADNPDCSGICSPFELPYVLDWA